MLIIIKMLNMKTIIFLILCLIIISCQPRPEQNSMPLKQLEESFLNPPEDAKPWTWWHWANGNVTKTGISYDLENMKRAGLEAVLIFNTELDMPKGKAGFMTDEWIEMLDHAASECERLGLKLGIFNCDGWSMSGGPWITPELSMKKLAWSKTNVRGPVRFSSSLVRPSTPEKPFVEDYYQDIAVIAFPTPNGKRINGINSGVSMEGTISKSELKNLIDNNRETSASFILESENVPVMNSITMEFQEMVTAQTLILKDIVGYDIPQSIPGTLEVSENGRDFREIASFNLNWCFRDSPQGTITVTFPETRGKIFRMSFIGKDLSRKKLSISELELTTCTAVQYWETKAGWVRVREHGGEAPLLAKDPGPEYNQMNLSKDHIVSEDQIQVFRNGLEENGHFEWDVPEGNWTIMRVGYTSTGKTNVQATEEGFGLEVNKFDADAVRFHLDNFVGILADRYSEKGLQSFQILENDSWEAGIQTWTKDLDKRFQSQKGLDLLHWIPLLTEGVVIEGYEESDRFLWEWRHFLADQIIEKYYQVVAEFAEEKGLTYVGEASGRVAYLYDPIRYQRIPQIPMGEFWTGPDKWDGVRLDNRVAASAAHITGKKTVATEAYTSKPASATWIEHPFSLKALGDKTFCEGVNKFVFHTYAHQPYPDLKPGFTMGRYGLHNNSGNTWWGRPVEAWFKYLARCEFMLQEGEFHADILAFIGSEVPSRLGRREDFVPAIPRGYDFDGCDFQALLDARVEKGIIVLPGGMHYKVILLPDKKRLRLEVVRRITELIQAGAVVITPQLPIGSLGIDELENGDSEIQKIVQEKWKDKVIVSRENLEGIMNELNIPADFTYNSTENNPEIWFIHRQMADCDVYFLSNQEDKSIDIEARFRQPAGRRISLWDPANGKKYAPIFYGSEGKDRIKSNLHLDPFGSVFVVFSDKVIKVEPSIQAQEEIPVGGTWTLQFPKEGGAPQEPLQLDKLIDWTTHPDFNIRHFSGTATYTTKLPVNKKDLKKGMHVLLHLGEVKEMAQVLINGQEAEMLWKPPFRTDITHLLNEGENTLEIKVTNLWPNRMIGDEYFPEEVDWKIVGNVSLPKELPQWMVNGEPRPASQRVTWTTRGRIYQKDDPLLPSGLLGPVKLILAKER